MAELYRFAPRFYFWKGRDMPLHNTGNSHQNNAYTNSTIEKLADNSQRIYNGSFVRLVNALISLCGPSDMIEGISITDVVTDSDNTTNQLKHEKIIYKPVRLEDTWKMYVANGTITEDDIGLYFNMDLNQDIDYWTINAWGGQFRLEKVLDKDNWLIGEFRIERNLWGPAWPQGQQWVQWPVWPVWPDWPRWPRGFKWDTWPMGMTGAMWPQWPRWLKWDKGDKGDQWLPGIDGKTPHHEWPRNSATAYTALSVVRRNGRSRWTQNATSVWDEPGVSSNRLLLNEDWLQGPQGPQWPAWPAWWPMGPPWPVGPPWSDWPAWSPWPQWPSGDDGPMWPSWPPGPMSNEFVQYWVWEDQQYDVPSFDSTSYLVKFQVASGNSAMMEPWANKNYMKAITQGTYLVSADHTAVSVPDANGLQGCNVARMLLFITDSSNAVDLTRFQFIDQKDGWGARTDEYANYFAMSGSARIKLNANDRIYMISRGSADNTDTGRVLIEGPRWIPWYGWVGPYGKTRMWMNKIYTS